MADEERRSPSPADPDQPEALVDKLGVQDDLNSIIFGYRGKIFSAAGRETPIAELDDEGGLVLHPPQLCLEDNIPTEEIVPKCDEYGICLNEIGERRKIIGATYRGKPLFWINETAPGTTKHYGAWFDDDWSAHLLYFGGEPMTVDKIVKIRARTIDGELSAFDDLTTDE